MPVLVHAAHRPPARALARRLLEAGGQVRATANAGVGLLRAEGIFAASCDPDDEGVLEAALTRVHTLVLLLGGLGWACTDALLREGHAAVRAAQGAAVQRVVIVTLAGADERAEDGLRRAHGEIAAALAASPSPSIEIRTGLIDTSAAADLLLAAGLPREHRSMAVSPVRLTDLIELVVAVDDARSRATEGHLVVAADGVSSMTLDEHLERCADRTRPDGAARLTGRRIPSTTSREALLATLDGPWRTEDASIPDAWTLFGTPVTAT